MSLYLNRQIKKLFTNCSEDTLIIYNMEFLGAVVLYFLFKFLHKLWEVRDQDKGRQYVRPDSRHEPEIEFKCGTDRSMPHIDLETSRAITLDLNTNKMEKTKVRALFLETLTNIGCQYEIDADDDRILFSYQGEHFVVDASDDRFYVTLWDMFWETAELYDIDELSRLKKAINGANLNYGVSTIYTINEEGSTVDVHCKSIIPFFPEISQLENYLRTELNEFFHVHRYVENELVRMRNEEEKIQTK